MGIDLNRAGEILNNVNYVCSPYVEQWRQIYYRTSIHTTGACPRFYPLSDRGTGYVPSEIPIYPLWGNAINAPYDAIFDTFLINRHPREPEVTRQWRKSVYRPYQMAPLLESINGTSACIFGDSKYTLIVEDKADNEYIWGKNFEGKTLVGYFEWMFKAICEDPNGLFLVIPKYSAKKTPEGSKVEPVIKHIPSRDILYITDTEVVFYEWDTPYGWFINELGYFQFRKDDTEYKLQERKFGYYAHLLKYRPAHFAGGIWNTHRYYDSYLKPAQPYCDDFVSAWSDVQMINKEASHPVIIEASEDCPSCRGIGQVTYCYSCNHKSNECECDEEIRNWLMNDCGKCGGSGQMSHNPADRMVVPKENMKDDMVKIISFDIEANKYLEEHAEKVAEGIKRSLYQYNVEEAQSGIAKEIDRDAMYLYRSTVSNGVWDLIEKCLIDILSLRNTVTEGIERKPNIPKYILVKPTDFDLKTESDLQAEYKDATEAKMPDWVRQKLVEQYVDKVYGGDEVVVKKASYINKNDPYSVMSTSDKISLLSADGIDKPTFLFSNTLPTLLDTVIMNEGSEWFLNAPFDEIKKKVDVEFKKLTPLPKAVDKTRVDIAA